MGTSSLERHDRISRGMQCPVCLECLQCNVRGCKQGKEHPIFFALVYANRFPAIIGTQTGFSLIVAYADENCIALVHSRPGYQRAQVRKFELSQKVHDTSKAK